MNATKPYLQTWKPPYWYESGAALCEHKNHPYHQGDQSRILAYANPLAKHIMQKVSDKSLDGLAGTGIEDILGSRKELLWSKIELTLMQLNQRKMTNQEVIYGIDQDLCQTQGLIMEREHPHQAKDRYSLQLEKSKLDLERQRRLEMTSCFRDTGMLNRDLIDTLIQYLDENQKSSLVAGLGVEA